MREQEEIQYDRVARAIEFITSNFKKQPSLEEIAEAVHLSPFHFQRLFTEWAGTSPKKFVQYISIEYAKRLLRENQGVTISEMTDQIGLSSTSRLHDLFVKIEGMTPAEYQHGGKNLHINFSFKESLFGSLIVASTAKGVCYMAFEKDKEVAFMNLSKQFPKATFDNKTDELQRKAMLFFEKGSHSLEEVKLHLKGTDFQLKVWESLLKIPKGAVVTYGIMAKQIGNPLASRAVGTAIGKNPVAFLIPCHRVIQASGQFGGYMWGTTRKTAIIGWEGAQGDLDLT